MTFSHNDFARLHDAVNWAYQFSRWTDEANAAVNLMAVQERPLTRLLAQWVKRLEHEVEHYGESTLFEEAQ